MRQRKTRNIYDSMIVKAECFVARFCVLFSHLSVFLFFSFFSFSTVFLFFLPIGIIIKKWGLCRRERNYRRCATLRVRLSFTSRAGGWAWQAGYGQLLLCTAESLVFLRFRDNRDLWFMGWVGETMLRVVVVL